MTCSSSQCSSRSGAVRALGSQRSSQCSSHSQCINGLQCGSPGAAIAACLASGMSCPENSEWMQVKHQEPVRGKSTHQRVFLVEDMPYKQADRGRRTCNGFLVRMHNESWADPKVNMVLWLQTWIRHLYRHLRTALGSMHRICSHFISCLTYSYSQEVSHQQN